MASAARIQAADAALRRVFPEVTDAQRVVILAHAMQEAQFGDAFQTPDGSSAYNWGAIYTKGDRGTLPRTDTDPAGKRVAVGAAWNSSDDVGARQLLGILRSSYPDALPAAARGSWYDYSRALWRDGPSYPGHVSKRPSWYVGFPPGHPYGLTPANVPIYSPLDFHWRIVAYARFVRGGGGAVMRALGIAPALDNSEPPPPAAEPPNSRVSTAGGGALAAGLILWSLWKVLRS